MTTKYVPGVNLVLDAGIDKYGVQYCRELLTCLPGEMRYAVIYANGVVYSKTHLCGYQQRFNILKRTHKGLIDIRYHMVPRTGFITPVNIVDDIMAVSLLMSLNQLFDLPGIILTMQSQVSNLANEIPTANEINWINRFRWPDSHLTMLDLIEDRVITETMNAAGCTEKEVKHYFHAMQLCDDIRSKTIVAVISPDEGTCWRWNDNGVFEPYCQYAGIEVKNAGKRK